MWILTYHNVELHCIKVDDVIQLGFCYKSSYGLDPHYVNSNKHQFSMASVVLTVIY